MESNFIPSSTAITLGTKSRTIKLFSNFSVKDGGSFGAKGSTKGNPVLYGRGYKATNTGLDDGHTNRAVTIAGYFAISRWGIKQLGSCLCLFCFVFYTCHNRNYK